MVSHQRHIAWQKVAVLAPVALAHYDVACFAGLKFRQNRQHHKKERPACRPHEDQATLKVAGA
jgi:hypothetical protein